MATLHVHAAGVLNLGSVADSDWRGSCAQCGWASSSGRATARRPARTKERAEALAARHNQVARRTDSLLARLSSTRLTDAQVETIESELRRLENVR